MNSVIQNILKRKNRVVPVSDNRKISLVLFGGIMVGARGAGSLIALQELGLADAFDEIHSMSCGFANGLGLLAHQSKETARVYYEKMSGLKLLNPLKFWGIADVDYLIRTIIGTPLDVDRISKSKTRLSTMLVNMSRGERHDYLYINDFNKERYEDLIRASFSLRVIGTKPAIINGHRYEDIYSDRSIYEFMKDILDSDATDILIVYNYEWQADFIRKNFPEIKTSRVFEIYPNVKSVWKGPLAKLSKFDTRRRTLKRECQIYADYTMVLFGYNKHISLK